LCRRPQAQGPVPLEGDVGQRRRDVQDQQPRNRGVTTGPIDTQTLDRPEGAEGREKNSDDQLEKAARNASNTLVESQPDPTDDDYRADAADRRSDQVVRART